MLNLEKEVVHHAPGQIKASGAYQPENDEVAVPAVHLIEAAAGNHIFVLEVQQAGSDLAGINLSGGGDNGRQCPHLHLAALLQVLHRWGCGEISRQVQHRRLGQLGINHGLAIRHGAGQCVPTGGYVSEDGGETRIRRGFGFGGVSRDASSAQPQD